MDSIYVELQHLVCFAVSYTWRCSRSVLPKRIQMAIPFTPQFVRYFARWFSRQDKFSYSWAQSLSWCCQKSLSAKDVEMRMFSVVIGVSTNICSREVPVVNVRSLSRLLLCRRSNCYNGLARKVCHSHVLIRDLSRFNKKQYSIAAHFARLCCEMHVHRRFGERQHVTIARALQRPECVVKLHCAVQSCYIALWTASNSSHSGTLIHAVFDNSQLSIV